MIVRFSLLGQHGRFGNQLLQYAFARATAEASGARLETAPWVGDVLFPHATHEPLTNNPYLRAEECPDIGKDCDIYSYCHRPQHRARYTRARAREWFALHPGLIMPKIRRWYVACHVRHGDYASKYPDHYPVVSRASYERAVTENGFDLRDVIWVSEETPHPWTIPMPPSQYDLRFLADWQILLHADVLFRGNSTFSWWAGELADHEAVFAPDTGDAVGPGDYTFATGNHLPLMPNQPEWRLAP